MHKEEAVEKNRLFDGKVIKLNVDKVKLENGEIAVREVIRHSGGAAVLAVDENNDLFFVRQYRYACEEEMLEIPAGKLNEGEDPLECAKRELLEETGLKAETWEAVGVFRPSPGYTDEKLYVYIARNLTLGKQNLDEDEFLDVVKLNATKAIKKVENGEITDAKSVIAIYKYALNDNNLA